MNHERYMQRAIELAKKGLGRTSPNPLVGAVIVHNNKIIGEGYHQEFGGPHAEVHAINSVEDKSLLKNSILYVTLEPCSHQGKTPPCANLILKHEIPTVVICNLDPHKIVAGRGIKLLEQNKTHVIKEILSKEGEWLNRRFFTSKKQLRPYVILKWAENQNGFMDKERANAEKGINWITRPETKAITHEWRAQEDAILVGANTIINDSPSLTLRNAAGNNPARIIIDPNNKIPDSHEFWKNEVKTIVFSFSKRNLSKDIEVHILEKRSPILKQVLYSLHQHSINSLIVEGGRHTLNEFIRNNLWDEARILTGKNTWQKGLKAPEVNGQEIEKDHFGIDTIKLIKRT